jgi:hypothetical protein
MKVREALKRIEDDEWHLVAPGTHRKRWIAERSTA